MTSIKTQFPTETWVNTTWDEYLQVYQNSQDEKVKFYYNNGRLRIEMTPLGNPHSRDHAIVIVAVNLFASLKGIDLDGHDNCTYRKTGFQDAQPDVSFYIGENAEIIPWETSIISLDQYPAPDLVIEVANSSLADDKGEKRLLYEDLGVKEYWIIDVNNVDVIAFAIANGGSRRINESQVLPNLSISVLKEVLRLSRQMNHGKVGAWLLEKFKE
ncbi:protein of unknown function DUF820 [Gloeothece citriformis PCC 7424]|uniref:Putative restriction endonuclease domain-containing protein n=1 Tax=Gloeothece citriformis (strain PCC 7424) TaxID=65393 RepID=B7KFT5_GLOC7|nr:Uma2 family endonuclease [Gloeothece citriformis]ACK73410.1 protein of unknown function DUF820 [Gloeothece citriformis PCC 7424]